MAKSARRRAHGARILNNWARSHKTGQEPWKLLELSFGKVFKQDPWDCGNSRKRRNYKERKAARREEREAYALLEEEFQ